MFLTAAAARGTVPADEPAALPAGVGRGAEWSAEAEMAAFHQAQQNRAGL